MSYIFKGSGVAIVTPFDRTNSVDYKSYENLLNFHIKNSTDAIIVCGTTGESATLDFDEKVKLIDYTVRYVNKRIPVIAGTGGNNTKQSIELSKKAELSGVDGLLVVTPYYNKTSQDGLVKHFISIADSVDIPIILYNVPSRTGMNIDIDSYKQLFYHKNIVATKEASGDISHIAKLISVAPKKFSVYSGNDDQILPILSLGGKGVISVFANILPKVSHDICSLFFEKDIEKSRELQLDYLELIDTMFIDINPVPVKIAMNLMGLSVGGVRPPLYESSEKIKNDILECMKRYKIV
ncbi:MAG: 4-hydroxy-tetrahydrodipicolinate synthase [Oscillospiraceae bacterium]|nr:4-hydroxy-tetrahydrodipicolinate synthase [Oscillospiraceae bacterium]